MSRELRWAWASALLAAAAATRNCLICSELLGPLEDDCRLPVEADCRRIIRSTATSDVRCLARLTHHPNGTRHMEKMCTAISTAKVLSGRSEEALLGCSSMREGRVELCVCVSANCNRGSVRHIRLNGAPAAAPSAAALLTVLFSGLLSRLLS